MTTYSFLLISGDINFYVNNAFTYIIKYPNISVSNVLIALFQALNF